MDLKFVTCLKRFVDFFLCFRFRNEYYKLQVVFYHQMIKSNSMLSSTTPKLLVQLVVEENMMSKLDSDGQMEL